HVADTGHALALALEELRLGIERIDLADTAVAENRNHGFGFGGEMLRLGGQRRFSGGGQDVGEGQARNAAPEAAEKFSARTTKVIPRRFHWRYTNSLRLKSARLNSASRSGPPRRY